MIPDDNAVFKALADPSRRQLLDLLHRTDGLSLNELCAPMTMSRFGVMKHLKILEDANLITTRKSGREKLHYLNAATIRQIHDRWVSKYTEPWVAELSAIKHSLEGAAKLTTKPKHVHRVAIKATPEQVWAAITDPHKTAKFWYNGAIQSEWKVGSPYAIIGPNGIRQAEGEILVLEPPHKLVMSWRLIQYEDTAKEPPSRITWEIESLADWDGVTLVTVVHDEFEQAERTAEVLEQGLPIVLSGMKTLLETGTPLV